MPMSNYEQVKFIEKIMDVMKEKLMEEAYKFPAEWDGWELRQLIADKVKEDVVWRDMDEDRMEEYENTRIIKNI